MPEREEREVGRKKKKEKGKKGKGKKGKGKRKRKGKGKGKERLLGRDSGSSILSTRYRIF